MSPSRALVAAIALSLALTGAFQARGKATPTVAQLAGQAIMTGVDGRAASPALLTRIRAGQVGGVILFSRNVGTNAELARLVAALQAAAAAGGNPALLIAVDQEGGVVKRLPAGPPDRSAAAMGRGTAVAAQAQGRATAVYLRKRGIDVDFAPVLDTPTSTSSFLGSRAFSTDPRLNAALGTAFAQGLQHGGVAATAKHFPGLGTARLSTDSSDVVLATPAPVLDRGLIPFARAIDGGVKLVMVSSAGYSSYDATGTPAVLSRPIVTGILRERLGFRGVVISDAMETPALARRKSAAVSAIAAGVDVLLYTGESTSAGGYRELLAAAKAGTLSRARLQSSAGRIAGLKGWLARR